jgi:hypothetical protein
LHSFIVTRVAVAELKTEVAAIKEKEAAERENRYSVYLLYWYKSTNSDAAARRRKLRSGRTGTQFTCFTGTNVLALRVQTRSKEKNRYSVYLFY